MDLDHPDDGDVEELPELTAEIVDDDELLAQAVDAVVLRDPDARRLMEEIVLQEEMFKSVVGADAWGLFLRLDELRNERFSELLLVVTRWAFRAGVTSAGPPRG